MTVVLASHALIADCFSVIRRPKPSHLRNRWIGGFAYALGLLNAFFHQISELTQAFATAFLGIGSLTTVFREELTAVNRTRLVWFLSGSGGMAILLVIPMFRNA